MGKIVFCTKKEDYEKMMKYIDSDFKSSFVYEKNNMYINVFKKLRVDSENYYCEGNGFVVGVGTFIYDGMIGEKALNKVFIDYGTDAFCKANIIGSFCILINKNKEIHLFSDSNYTYSIYYYMKKDRLIVTNTYYHIAKTLNNCVVDNDNLVAQCFQNSIVGNETIFNGIYRLNGNQTLSYKDGLWTIHEDSSAREINAIENMWQYVLNKYRLVFNNYSNTSICMSGGQDSRINLALMLKLGATPTLYYGKGNSQNTNTKHADEVIVKEIAQQHNLELKYMNWDDTDDEGMQYYLDKYGELFLFYRMNKNIFEEFEKKICTEFISFGYYGEILRNVEDIESYPKENFSVHEYVDELYISPIVKACYNNYGSYRDKLVEQFSYICKKNKIDRNYLHKYNFQTLNSHYRFRSEGVANNFANQFFYSFPLLIDDTLRKIVEQKNYEDKSNSKLLMQGINCFEPRLLDIDIFSRMTRKRLNKRTLELKDASIVYRYKGVIKHTISNPTVIRMLRKIYYFLVKDKKGQKELKQSYDEKKNYLDTMQFQNLYGVDSERLIKACDNSRTIYNLLLHDYLIKNIQKRG